MSVDFVNKTRDGEFKKVALDLTIRIAHSQEGNTEFAMMECNFFCGSHVSALLIKF